MRPPFDTTRLDELLLEGSVDAVAATSRHNVRYLLGTYSVFFNRFDAIGVDRFLPVAGYVRGRLDHAFAVASTIDRDQLVSAPPWVPTSVTGCETVAETAQAIVRLLRERNLASATVAIEKSFLPLRAARILRRLLPHVRFVEATPILEELRAVKTERELALMRAASECVLESFDAAIRPAVPGTSTRELARCVAVEEVARGLTFSYCLIAAGRSLDRTPSNARWQEGEVLSVDSGGELEGYVGDLCRMAVLGEPDAELVDLLGQLKTVQNAARRAIVAGVLGHEIVDAAHAARTGCDYGSEITFVAHGVGLVNHEAPRVLDVAPRHYRARHRNRPLEPGMVLSLESEVAVPSRGLIKLEDTVAVTANGSDPLGAVANGWICV